MKKIFFLCDGEIPDCKKRICQKNKEEGCRHTTDIEHAVNFKRHKESGSYWERKTNAMVIKVKLDITEIGKIHEFIEKHITPLQEKYPHAEIHIEVSD